MSEETQGAAPENQPDTTQGCVIDLDESEIAAIEAQAAENSESWLEPDSNFIIISEEGTEDGTQEIIICPAREDARSIKLGKQKAELLIEIIRRQIQNWS